MDEYKMILRKILAILLISPLFCSSPIVSQAEEIVTRPLQQCGLGTLNTIDYSPNGKYILTGGTMGAFLWDIEIGEVIRQYDGHTQIVRSVKFSHDESKLLTISDDGTLKIWDVHTGNIIDTIPFTPIAISHDGSKMMTGGDTSIARVYDFATGQEIQQFSGHNIPISSGAFSPDDTYILTGSQDNTAKLWDLETGQELGTYYTHLSIQLELILYVGLVRTQMNRTLVSKKGSTYATALALRRVGSGGV